MDIGRSLFPFVLERRLGFKLVPSVSSLRDLSIDLFEHLARYALRDNFSNLGPCRPNVP